MRRTSKRRENAAEPRRRNPTNTEARENHCILTNSFELKLAGG